MEDNNFWLHFVFIGIQGLVILIGLSLFLRGIFKSLSVSLDDINLKLKEMNERTQNTQTEIFRLKQDMEVYEDFHREFVKDMFRFYRDHDYNWRTEPTPRVLPEIIVKKRRPGRPPQSIKSE